MGSDVTGLEGKSYGPYPLRVCSEKVDEFVAATRDSHERWQKHAPPGWAATALFVVAPRLFEDPDLITLARSIIHGEQRFAWEGPIESESDLEVIGSVKKVRERGGVFFLTFDVDVTRGKQRLFTGSAIFLMSSTAPSVGEGPEVEEPEPHVSGENDPVTGDTIVPIRRSASRGDLVRYAAATRDWNPIHWDHRSAVEAGLPGVVVHGLLQAAWLLSAASRRTTRPDPFIDARFRFRSPLLVGVEAMVSERLEAATIASLKEGDREIASATINLR